jgi:hypothetical protein
MYYTMCMDSELGEGMSLHGVVREFGCFLCRNHDGSRAMRSGGSQGASWNAGSLWSLGLGAVE